MPSFESVSPDSIHNYAVYIPLTEIADFVRGVTYSKDDEQLDGPITVLRSNNVDLQTNRLDFSDVKKVSAKVQIRPDQSLRRGDLLMSAASGSKAHVGKIAYIVEDMAETFGGFMAVVRASDAILPRYLFHVLNGGRFAKYLDDTLTSTTINNISKTTLSGFSVPLPSLQMQSQLADILDAFTDLVAELEAELDARKKQFAHYREVLFDFENDTSVDWLPLSDFANIGTGNRNTNQAENEGQFPFFVRSQNALRSNEFDFDEEAVVTAGDGVGVGKVLHYVDGKYALHQRAYRISPKDDRVLAKFLFHFMKKDFGQYLQTTSVHASVTSLRRPMFEKYKVPVPNLTRQREIIVVLDALETLASDFESGIPGELSARRKQHAYYRDLLLAFEEA